MMRQFPLEEGFTLDQTIFVGHVAATGPIHYKNGGIEEVETPIGTFKCLHTEIHLSGQTQHFYTTTDDARQVVKLKVGGAEAVAIRSDVVKDGETYTHTNEGMGFAVDVPTEWVAVDLSDADGKKNRARILFRDSWKPGDIAVVAMIQGDVKETDAETARDLAEKNSKSFANKLGLVVDESSWVDHEVSAGSATSYSGTYEGSGEGVLLKGTIVQAGDKTLAFTLRGSPDWVEENTAKFEEMINSARYN